MSSAPFTPGEPLGVVSPKKKLAEASPERQRPTPTRGGGQDHEVLPFLFPSL